MASTDDRRKQACADIVRALRAWRAAKSDEDGPTLEEENAMFEMRRAANRLEELCSDDTPPPRDLAAICKSILLDPYKGGGA